MKTKLLLCFLLFPFAFFLSPCTAQVPMGFNYQAIARDGSGSIIANQSMPVEITLQTSLIGGTLIYKELFASISSNQFGMISLVVGTGTQTGGSATSFSAIDWSAQTLFVKTAVQYPGSTWTTMGTSQVWAVPYSLVAKNIAPLSKLGITGTTTDMEEALFEVKNQAGNTVFAVYNEGIRAYVGNGDAKGAKGGFSVGGYDATKGTTIYDLFTLNTDSARIYVDSKPNLKGVRGGFSVGGYDMTKGGIPVQNYLEVSKDSVRIYIDSNPLTKGKKGGFSVGGYDMTKGGIPAQDYMHVSKDSVRVYVDSNPATKGKRGGFAVGGYDLTKGGVTINKFLAVNPDSTRIFTTDANKGFGVGSLSTGVATSYLKLTPENYFIGHQSGKATTTGKYNSFLGYQTGLSNTTGGYNTILGYQAGYTNSVGTYNVFLGYKAGYFSTSSYNTFLGYQAGITNTIGEYNAFIGYNTGLSNTSGSNNVFLGNESGRSNITGSFNTFLGYQAGYTNDASYNSFIGYQAGLANTSGRYNVFLGFTAGYKNTVGEENVFVGEEAGHENTTGNLNTFIGKDAGYLNTEGYRNVFLGWTTGLHNTTGAQNVLLGDIAGYSNTTGCSNVCVGPGAGFGLKTGYLNICIGSNAGLSYPNYILSGWRNVFVGCDAGQAITSGEDNVMVGPLAGQANDVGSRNVYIGDDAAQYNISGNDNVIIGSYAGQNITAGSNNIFIGQYAGPSITGSNLLYINNSTTYTNTPLIWGDFNARILNFNGKVGIGTTSPTAKLHIQGSTPTDAVILLQPSAWNSTSDYGELRFGDISHYIRGQFNTGMTFYDYNCFYFANANVGIGTSTPGYKLTVNGTTWCSSGGWTGSDIRWKKNISEINDVLINVLALKPVTYQLRADEFPEMNFTNDVQIGLIAQDVEKVFPNLVMTDNKGYKAVSYEKLSVILLEGMKEQQMQIESYKSEIQTFRTKVNQIESQQKEIDELKTLVNSLIANQTAQVNK